MKAYPSRASSSFYVSIADVGDGVGHGCNIEGGGYQVVREEGGSKQVDSGNNSKSMIVYWGSKSAAGTRRKVRLLAHSLCNSKAGFHSQNSNHPLA